MIEIKNLKLNIDNIDILNDISFNVEDNSVTCILGYNNSGKSSILKTLSGIYKNYYGEVLFNGVDLNDINSVEIDMLHDNREIDADLTVIEYLKFYSEIYGKNDTETFINDMLKKMSLMSYKYTNINMLDNYDYKLVELIRVMINNPKVILFDDIFSTDNIEFNEKLMEFVYEFKKDKTLIFASRSLNYLEGIVTHIGIIENGTLISYGTKEEIYRSAELSNKIEVKVIDDTMIAVEILNKDEKVSDITYTESLISFSLKPNFSFSSTRKNIESEILKELIDNGIKVYSYKRQRVRFEQLFGRIVG